MLRRALRQSWTYGIGDGTLTKREKRVWITFLYLLVGSATYYQLKDMAREDAQGHFGFRDTVKWWKNPFALDDEEDLEVELPDYESLNLEVPAFILRNQLEQ